MKKNSLKIVLIFGIFLLTISSNNVYALYQNGDSNPSGYENKCKMYLGINIEASEYKRVTSVSTNNVEERKITMTCRGRCKYYIYYANYGDLEKLGNQTTNEDDEDTDDVTYKLKKKTFTNSDTWKLPAGKEALVVVLSLRNKKCKNDSCSDFEYESKLLKKTKKCLEKNDDTCIKYSYKNSNVKYDCDGSKCTVTCTRGKFNSDDNPTTVDEVELKGNSAALFVQNPDESGLVPNLRVRTNDDYGEACRNAYDGVYTGKENNDYSITNESDKDLYRNNYYKKFMQYCDKDYFAFNLKSSQIEKMSNSLLKMFYYAKNISSDNYSAVSDTISQLEDRIKSTYGSEHIVSNVNQVANPLTCDYSTKRRTEDEYLYVENDSASQIKATLSTGDVSVCKTKCYEHLTVKYDAPKTVKAGLCFSYKVTVKSVSECAVEPQFDLNMIAEPATPCSPNPICSNKASHTQAGPNSDFDSCISSCDGGKYSQSCINSCYNKVYKNKTKNKVIKNNTSSNDRKVISSLVNKFDGSSTLLIAKKDKDYTEEYLANYYKEDNNKSCNTEKIIEYVRNGKESNINECAEYFFQAKSLNPYGNYNKKGTEWKKDDNVVTDAGAEVEATTNIPMQIARSSPFYLRSIEETANLLKSLVVPSEGLTDPKGKNSNWRKYNIDEGGVKRQYSTRFKCDEVCSFTGCAEGTAVNKNHYTDNTSNDLDKLAEALKKCSASMSCDKKVNETQFDISINSKRTNNQEVTVLETGSTELGNSAPLLDSNGIFVPRNDDTDTTTGILGLCYDRKNTPHYQTTITYPGTYISYKTGERKYSSTNDKFFFKKDKYFCTPYDEADINAKYGYWAFINNYDEAMYPSNFSPVFNIKANLGKSNETIGDKGFGKYNWNINFQCFYSSLNESWPPECVEGDSNCPKQQQQPQCIPGEAGCPNKCTGRIKS